MEKSSQRAFGSLGGFFSPIFCPYLDIWGLASPTMHGEELKYVTEAYETNWMSTVGKNINEVEKIAEAGQNGVLAAYQVKGFFENEVPFFTLFALVVL